MHFIKHRQGVKSVEGDGRIRWPEPASEYGCFCQRRRGAATGRWDDFCSRVNNINSEADQSLIYQLLSFRQKTFEPWYGPQFLLSGHGTVWVGLLSCLSLCVEPPLDEQGIHASIYGAIKNDVIRAIFETIKKIKLLFTFSNWAL